MNSETSSTDKMPIDILLVEPDALLREQLALVLTTTGGMSVRAVSRLPPDNSSMPSIVILPANQCSSASSFLSPHTSFVLTSPSATQSQVALKNAASNCIGAVQLEPIMAVAEQLRQLLQTRAELCAETPRTI